MWTVSIQVDDERDDVGSVSATYSDGKMSFSIFERIMLKDENIARFVSSAKSRLFSRSRALSVSDVAKLKIEKGLNGE